MRFISTLSFPLFLSSLVSSSAPNPNQIYSLQQQAYLKPSSPSHIDPKPRFKKLDKRLRKETEDEWAVHKNHHEGPSSVKRHLERRVKRMGIGSEGHGNLKGLKGKGMQKKLRRVKKATHSQPHLQGFVDSSSSALEKRGGGMFKGVSSYYLFALDDGPRRQVLDAIKGGGFTVVRIFLSGVGYNNKGSGNNAVPDLEPDKVGEYDDTILYKIDKLMADCQDRGLKLMIALSDRYALGFWSTNAYAVQLSIVEAHEKGKQSLKKKNAHAFYSDGWSIEMFEKRISHALNHENQLLGGRKWRDLSNVVYAFEAQNEPQGYMDTANPSWVCDRSNYISSLISGSGIQISSGGGTEIGNSLGGWATNCGSIDIVSVHDYGRDGYNIAGALARAKNIHPSKTIMMGEWGITGSSKVSKIKEFVNAFEERGIPWMYWQVTQPGAGDKDFEVWTSEPAWGALTGGSSYSPPPPAADSNNNDDDWEKKESSSSSAKPSRTSSSSSSSDDDKDSSATPSPSKSTEWNDADSSSSPKKSQWSKSSEPSWVPSATPSSTTGEIDSQEDSAAKSFLASHDGANSTSTSDQAESTVFVGKDGSTSLGSEDDGEANFSTIEISPEDADQYSTISPDDLEGYSIIAEEPSTSSSTSSEGTSSSEGASSTIDSSTSSTDLSTSSPSSSTVVSVSEDLPSSLEATAIVANALPSESATPSPEILPSSSTDSLADNLTIKLPNCNYTLSDLNGTIPDANSTIHLLPSGIFCNSTLLPLSELPHPTPTDSLSAESTNSPLLLFSSDPGSALPDFSTSSSSSGETTIEIETPTETIQENDTAFAEVPTPAPAVEPAYVDITLDADALLTMDLRDYSIVNR